MGILEDVLLNARTAVDAVGKKAGSVIDMSKLTIAAADLKSEINKKYEILGRVTFESKTTGKMDVAWTGATPGELITWDEAKTLSPLEFKEEEIYKKLEEMSNDFN